MFLINALVILTIVLTVLNVGKSNVQECKLLTECPALLSMIQNKPNHQETIRFLRSRHCGFDDRMPKVWCDNDNFMTLACKTPNFLNGTCTPIKECKYMLSLLRTLNLNDANVKAFVRGHKCSTLENKNVNVCCPTKSTTEEFRQLWPSSGQCGTNNPFPDCPRGHMCMIFAQQTSIAQYPWMALLFFRKLDGTVYSGCGGSLINKKFVLTAAHCLDRDIWNERKIDKVEFIALGEHDVRTDPDCIDHDECADPVKKVFVENFYVHHQWNRHTIKNDIALLKLKETISFTDFVRPICLPKRDSELFIGKTVTVAGWGKTELGRSSSVLMNAILPIVNRSNCSFMRKELSSKQLCIGVFDGSDSCQGDSGGPVMNLEYHDDRRTFSVVGIVSYGIRCGLRPGVYTYVTPYLDWIQGTVEKDTLMNV